MLQVLRILRRLASFESTLYISLHLMLSYMPSFRRIVIDISVKCEHRSDKRCCKIERNEQGIFSHSKPAILGLTMFTVAQISYSVQKRAAKGGTSIRSATVWPSLSHLEHRAKA